MTNTSSVREGGFIYNQLSVLFNKLFSRRMKRLVFISSIVGLVYKVKDPDIKVISKLNAILDLANSPQAMELPYRVKSVIWKDKDLNILGHDGKAIHIEDVKTFEMDSTDIDNLSTQVVSQTPWWLKYSSTEVMCSDLKTLFKQIRNSPKPSFA